MNGKTHVTEKKRGNGSKTKKSSIVDSTRGILQTTRPYLVYYILILAAIGTIDLMIRPISALDISGFRIGQPSPRVVSAPFEFDYVDEIKTQDQQSKAEALVSPIYRLHPENLTAMKTAIATLAETLRTTPLGDNDVPNEWIKTVLQNVEFQLDDRTYKLPAADSGNTSIPKSTYESLFNYRLYESLWKAIGAQIDVAAGRGIAENVQPLNLENPQKPQSTAAPRLSVPVTLIAEDGTQYAAPVQEIRTPLQFFSLFKQRIAVDFPDPIKDFAARELSSDILQEAYSGPTLIYDRERTEALKEKARNEVAPAIAHINKEETIIGKNELVTVEHLQTLSQLHGKMRVSSLAEIGYLMLALLYVLIILRYLYTYHPEVSRDTRKVTVILLGVLMILALTRIAVHLSLLDLGSHKLSNVAYAVPLGALGVILTLLVHSRLALFCSSLTAIYMGIILNGGTNLIALPYILVAFVTACGAIYTVSRIRQRSDLYRAGGVAIFLASALILALSLNQYKYIEQLLIRAEELKWALIWGGVNGGLISILSMALLPIFEDFYGVVTDMKLLELSQKNDILQRLEQEAPGSYQHSMRVATLAETAAESIEANALLTRVGCYYHDIGKTVKPQYFVENQQTSADKAKHSKLTTNMSCFLIRSHVKHGIELAQKYKLPKVIVDFIPEHHGTHLMSYFYHQALEEQGAEGAVKESDFRYPGPKPQSKETAIAMLADALEASSRTLENPAERDVRQLVRKIINDRFMDGQFDQCNLTLKDLHTLFLSFSESIMSMLHQRIVYPTAAKEKETEADKNTNDDSSNESESTQSPSDSAGAEKPSTPEQNERSKDKPVALKLE